MIELDVQHVIINGDNGRCVLNISALSATSGILAGITGPSGAGKTTFLYLLAGLLVPDRGVVRWGKTDLASLAEGERDAFRRKHIGFIFQDFLLFEELSALANASVAAGFAPKKERAQIVCRAADFLKKLGITDVHRRVETFSGGERQRIAVARSLASNPKIILADEPTASLDQNTADRLLADLLTIVHEDGKSLFVVSHDPRVLEKTDRRIEIFDGSVLPGREEC